MSILTVGTGQQFSTISEAIAASRDGDVVQVQAGTYTNDFAAINTDITLQSVGGMVKMVATASPSDGKAIFTTNADVTIQGFEFTGVRVPDQNGAGIRLETGNLTVLDSYFHDNETGILTAYDPNATLTIRNSEFAGNLATSTDPAGGLSHGVYVGGIASVTIEDSLFRDAQLGHQIKSRAEETTITGSRFFDNDGTASYSIDIPNGGKAVLTGNVIQQGENSQNPVIVAFGEEGDLYSGSSLTMTGNTVVNDLPGGVMVWNAIGAPATVSDNQILGLTADQIVNGSATVTGTTYLASKPAFDTSSPWGDGSTLPSAAPGSTGAAGANPLPDSTGGPSSAGNDAPAGSGLGENEAPAGTADDASPAGEASNDFPAGSIGDDAFVFDRGPSQDTSPGSDADLTNGRGALDLPVGENGNDAYVFDGGFGQDTVSDFYAELLAKPDLFADLLDKYDLSDFSALNAMAGTFGSDYILG